jgi:hypothetical protein
MGAEARQRGSRRQLVVLDACPALRPVSDVVTFDAWTPTGRPSESQSTGLTE